MSIFPREIRSERLIFRPLYMSVGVHELYEYCKAGNEDSEVVTEYMSWSPHTSLRETEEAIDNERLQWQESEQASYGLFTNEVEGERTFIGIASLDVEWEKRRGEVGVWLVPDAWGEGYGYERALVLMEMAFEICDLDVVQVKTLVDNDRARESIEKYISDVGGKELGVLWNEFVVDDIPRDVAVYAVRREVWRESDVESIIEDVDLPS